LCDRCSGHADRQHFACILSGRGVARDGLTLWRSANLNVISILALVVSDHIVALLRWHDLVLELKQPNNRSIEYSDDGYFNHICFEVNNIESIVNELREKGINTWLSENIAVFPAYGGLKNIFFRGPDGEQIELFQYYPTNQ